MPRRESPAVTDVRKVIWAHRKDNNWEAGKMWMPYLRNYCFPSRPVCRCGAEVAFAALPSGSMVIVEKGSAGNRDGKLAVWSEGRTLRAWRLDEGRELLPGMHQGTEHVRDRCPAAKRSASAKKAAKTRWRREQAQQQGKL